MFTYLSRLLLMAYMYSVLEYIFHFELYTFSIGPALCLSGLAQSPHSERVFGSNQQTRFVDPTQHTQVQKTDGWTDV